MLENLNRLNPYIPEYAFLSDVQLRQAVTNISSGLNGAAITTHEAHARMAAIEHVLELRVRHLQGFLGTVQGHADNLNEMIRAETVKLPLIIQS